MDKDAIKRIYIVAKEYQNAVFSADELFQIGFIGNMRGEQSGLTGDKLVDSIRNEIELFLKAQQKNVQ